MNTQDVLEIIQRTESPLKRQLLTVALITRLLETMGKSAPVIIGGCALSYYSREVYFTGDIDLAYADREALDSVLREIGFRKQGRYWVHEGLKTVIEVPASGLAGEDSPIEIVEIGEGLQCRIIGIEDLLNDRLNACGAPRQAHGLPHNGDAERHPGQERVYSSTAKAAGFGCRGKHWKSQIDCEMVELLAKKYFGDLDWSYLEKKSRTA